MTAVSQPTLVPVADHGVLVSFADHITDAARAGVHALDVALVRRAPPGLVEIVPAMTTLLVLFDPLVTDHDAIGAVIVDCLGSPGTVPAGAEHLVDVCYEGEHAPDLTTLAERCGLDVDAVADAHLAGTYTVGMYGFAPGYAYLYGTPTSIQQPRNPTPGPLRPAGSVIVAGQQCLVIPTALSTGWFAIGRSPASVFRADHHRPFLFDVGDTVRFRRIDPGEFTAQLAERLGGSR
jgi:inhibitor of KinA